MSPRPPDDLTAAFARLGGEEDQKVWSELWDDLCHQGSVYDDSFLALPFLTAIATGCEGEFAVSEQVEERY
ncbi:hypothetical protein ABZ957_16790 [Streptomyces sp. NPDC046316]|uniref:hypothetical protein n=1 Tax=Streptomyces sp. NPDC046316 TaxID=3154494 RepID=UPI0033BFF979